jgi:hypothetical protein
MLHPESNLDKHCRRAKQPRPSSGATHPIGRTGEFRAAILVPKDAHVCESGEAEQVIAKRGMPHFDFAIPLTKTESLGNTMILAI